MNKIKPILNIRNVMYISKPVFYSVRLKNTPMKKSSEELFLNPLIHNLLFNMINKDPIKVHDSLLRKRKIPKLLMMTDEQLTNKLESSRIKTTHRLQMPPIMNPRKESTDLVIEKDDLLDGIIARDQKFVFTDISLRTKSRNRDIVVREADGTLRHVTHAERDRLNQTYFPIPGRSIVIPKMFSTEQIEDLISRNQHIYVLDRACIQFEPDDPEYLRVLNDVYNKMTSNENSLYTGLSILESTRHFGGLILHLVQTNKMVPYLINHFLQWERFGSLICLFHLITVSQAGNSVSTTISKILGPMDEYKPETSPHNFNVEMALKCIDVYINTMSTSPIKDELIEKAKFYKGNKVNSKSNS